MYESKVRVRKNVERVDKRKRNGGKNGESNGNSNGGVTVEEREEELKVNGRGTG